MAIGDLPSRRRSQTIDQDKFKHTSRLAFHHSTFLLNHPLLGEDLDAPVVTTPFPYNLPAPCNTASSFYLLRLASFNRHKYRMASHARLYSAINNLLIHLYVDIPNPLLTTAAHIFSLHQDTLWLNSANRIPAASRSIRLILGARF
jgi:hypothetical protein